MNEEQIRKDFEKAFPVDEPLTSTGVAIRIVLFEGYKAGRTHTEPVTRANQVCDDRR